MIVDDGSRQEYTDIFSDCSAFAYVLCHSANIGKGAALKTGLIDRLLQIGGCRYGYEMNMLLEFADEGISIMEHEI